MEGVYVWVYKLEVSCVNRIISFERLILFSFE